MPSSAPPTRSLQGFEQAIQPAGEAKKPQQDVSRAVLTATAAVVHRAVHALLSPGARRRPRAAPTVEHRLGMTTSTDPVVTLRSPADVVGALPYLIGFRPAESLVVLCLEGSRRRAGLTIRLDLPPPGHEGDAADAVAEPVRRAGAGSAVLVVCTEAPDDADAAGALAGAALADVLTERLAGAGTQVVEALLVRAGRWWSYRCDGPCCPPQGTSLPVEPTSAATRCAAEAVGRGHAPLADRAALVASIGPAPDDTGRLDAVFGRAAGSRAIRRTAPDHRRTATLRLLQRTALHWADGVREISDGDVALIALGLGDKTARDHAATMALDVEPAVLLSLFTELARRTTDSYAAPVCTVLAWLAYSQGSGALANVALDRALAADARYEMALILRSGLAAGVPPSAVRAVTAAVRAELGAPGLPGGPAPPGDPARPG